jgi:DNA-binding MarR family transcriptional regulator
MFIWIGGNKVSVKNMTDQQHDPGQLEMLFGKSAIARVLDFMHIFDCWDYNIKDIAENSGVSPRHATTAITKLEKLEFIKKTRTIGNSQMYQYNTESKAAMTLDKFTLLLADQEVQKIIEQENLQTEDQNPTETKTQPEPQELLTTPA